MKYGSKSQLTDEIIAQAEEDIKVELKAEGKPENLIKSSLVKWFASCLTTPVDQQYTLAQVYHGRQQNC